MSPLPTTFWDDTPVELPRGEFTVMWFRTENSIMIPVLTCPVQPGMVLIHTLLDDGYQAGVPLGIAGLVMDEEDGKPLRYYPTQGTENSKPCWLKSMSHLSPQVDEDVLVKAEKWLQESLCNGTT